MADGPGKMPTTIEWELPKGFEAGVFSSSVVFLLTKSRYAALYRKVLADEHRQY